LEGQPPRNAAPGLVRSQWMGFEASLPNVRKKPAACFALFADRRFPLLLVARFDIRSVNHPNEGSKKKAVPSTLVSSRFFPILDFTFDFTRTLFQKTRFRVPALPFSFILESRRTSFRFETIAGASSCMSKSTGSR